jgi:plastocyanin
MRIRRGLRLCAVPLLITVLVAAGCGDDKDDDKASDTTATTVAAPKDIEIGAGANDPKDPNVAILAFMPAKVTVAVDTPVVWTWAGSEPHSVTFLTPGTTLPDPGSDPSLFAPTPPTGAYDGTTFVNSGLLPLSADAPPPFEMSFSKAGSYPYHCVIHPGMNGTVEVTDGATVDSPADVAKARAADLTEYLAEGRAAKADLVEAAPTKSTNDDGSTNWTVKMGATTEHTDILAFAPTPAGVKAGDTVTFLNDSGAPHTASFFGEGAEPINDPTDPRVDPPAPGPSPQELLATGFFNTGLLPPNAPPGSGPPEAVRSYVYKVPTAGTYSYVCLLHAPSQMIGEIDVT